MEDVAYLREAVTRTFSGLTLPFERAIGAWAGLRPLIREVGKKPSEISRKDEIVVSPSRVVTIAGGKLTAYRRMAERVVDIVAPLIGRKLPASASAERLLAGGDLAGAPNLEAFSALPAVRAALASADQDTASRLIATYGSDAIDVARSTNGPDALMPLAPEIPLSATEVRYAVRHEMAQTLVDVLERRTRLAFFSTEIARIAAPAVAMIMASELGWNESRSEHEVSTFTRQCDARLAWREAPQFRKENR